MNDDTGKIEEQTTDFVGMLLVFFASKQRLELFSFAGDTIEKNS
jgi:hypothetical protein